MGRIRTIKPGFWTHEDLSELPPETHMLAAALLNYADDEGYFNANPKLVKAACCPLREDSVSVQESLTRLAAIGFIRLGTGSDGKRYGHIPTFQRHQRVNRPRPSEIATREIAWDGAPGDSCPPLTEDSVNDHGTITDDSMGEGKGMEGKGTTSAPSGAGEEAKRSGPNRAAYPEEFEQAWSLYPKRDGGNPKAKALKAWRARRKAGIPAEDLQAGVGRYARYVRARSKEGTPYVMQTATFFGPDEHWRESWSADPPPDDRKRQHPTGGWGDHTLVDFSAREGQG
ncbi:hypothetical protein [Arhodomonas sp. SL1]|uniref:hypothetical protein n=1 Tax=Arhodomonas sp. SL1 TaxID=3425691 RepID=UPI003F88299C